ncbi:hypothetical protein [Knoellia sp. LjRoot47]|uniref:hypothetical protein n=1 Tax=Knoellia sp. LjRoot47 TaxID=3342330 RepID=UPI003ECFF0B7
MAVDDDRRQTAGRRRELIIETFSRELDTNVTGSAAGRLRDLFATHSERHLIVSGDIDGLASAAMLARSAPPGWRAIALVVKSGDVLLHPDFVDGTDLSKCFGVDVYSTYIDNVSNHVALWGDKRPGSSAEGLAIAQAYDTEVKERAKTTLLATPSLWAGIQGSQSRADVPASAGYRYPLGTVHVLLALLEAVDRSPRLFDREYLPWLLANCDGGLKTIRDYPHNVPLWWSSLAAAVGPATLSESLYQTAARQAPIAFVDTVNRLRAESHLVDGAPAQHLNDDWNLRAQSVEAITAVTKWISSLSGWPDPFLGGSAGLKDWKLVPLHRRGRLLTKLPDAATMPERLELFRAHFRASLDAVHTNFAYFDGQQRLNWVAPWVNASHPSLPAIPPALQPDQNLFSGDVDVANADDKDIVI